MKIAILIQCHKNPKQINLLLERLNHPDIDCYLHIDKKADFADKIIHRENVFVLPDEQRVSVEWAQISQVTATLNLLNTAVASARGGYDYYWLISGQDWPLRSVEEILCNITEKTLFNIGVARISESTFRITLIKEIKYTFLSG